MQVLRVKLIECGLFAFVPDTTPTRYVDIGWGGKDADTVCMFGNVLPLGRCADKPTFHYRVTDSPFISVLAFDADRSDCSDTNCYLQWARVNVSGDTQYSTGKDLFRWQPPQIAPESSPHRVFFLVLAQEREVAVDDWPVIAMNSKEQRANFSFPGFAARLGLTRFIGANCCRLNPDEGVFNRLARSLRDSIELDSSGKKIVAETLNGVRTVFGTGRA